MVKGMPRAFPFYVVCDVSGSMRDERAHGVPTPFEVLQNAVQQMIIMLEDNDTASEAAYLSVIAFADDAEVVLPLTVAHEADQLPKFREDNLTNYGAVFKLLADRVVSDCASMATEHELRPPVVFFLTDGYPYLGNGEPQPEAEWMSLRDQLARAVLPCDPPASPHILAFGFGAAQHSTLCKVATSELSRPLAFLARDDQQVTEVLESIATSILRSIVRSVTSSRLDVVVPEGMVRLDCTAT